MHIEIWEVSNCYSVFCSGCYVCMDASEFHVSDKSLQRGLSCISCMPVRGLSRVTLLFIDLNFSHIRKDICKLQCISMPVRSAIWNIFDFCFLCFSIHQWLNALFIMTFNYLIKSNTYLNGKRLLRLIPKL